MNEEFDIFSDAADKWVFEENGHKWSNNDDTGNGCVYERYATEIMN